MPDKENENLIEEILQEEEKPLERGGPPETVGSQAVTVNAEIKFANSLLPEKVDYGEDLYSYNLLEIKIKLGDAERTTEPVVKKIRNSYYLGSRMTFNEEIKPGATIDEIVFSQQGYKSVTFKGLKLINGNILKCPLVVMEPLN